MDGERRVATVVCAPRSDGLFAGVAGREWDERPMGVRCGSLEAAQVECERALLDDLDPEIRRDVVWRQWLQTAETAHERLQLRARWRRQDRGASS